MKGVVILVPVAGSIHPRCEAALSELEDQGYCVRRVPGYSAIDQARNQMATDALEDGFAATLWVDSDVGFSADDVVMLLEHDVPIACGIYPKKGLRSLSCHVLPGTEELVFGREGGLTEIQYAATGFLLVRRTAYEAIREKLRLPVCNQRFGKPMVPYFQPMVVDDNVSQGSHWYLAEDFAFSERARQCGFKIYADTRIRLFHFGDYGFSWEDAGESSTRYESYRFRIS